MSGQLIINDNSIAEGDAKISLRESVRRSPGMYLGGVYGKAIVDLVCSLVKGTINIYDTDNLFFTFSINGNNNFSLEINSEVNEKLLIDSTSIS